MIRTCPSFHSLSFGYLPHRLMRQVAKLKPFTENDEKNRFRFLQDGG